MFPLTIRLTCGNKTSLLRRARYDKDVRVDRRVIRRTRSSGYDVRVYVSGNDGSEATVDVRIRLRHSLKLQVRRSDLYDYPMWVYIINPFYTTNFYDFI